MTTGIYYHPDIFLHDRHADHVAMAADRIATVCEAVLKVPGVTPVLAEPATYEQIHRNHGTDLISRLKSSENLLPGDSLRIDGETILNNHSWRAMKLSAGAACQAVEAVVTKQATNAFCPGYAGHHATRDRASGFCFINSVAIAARHALSMGVEKVAILDFDTHSGNGTVLSFIDEPSVLFAETYQPGYPGDFLLGRIPSNILRTMVSWPAQFHNAWEELLAHVADFKPELILVSAGFDAHLYDPLGVIGLSDDDFTKLFRAILNVSPNVVACLEGGYELDATTRNAVRFVRELVAAA